MKLDHNLDEIYPCDLCYFYTESLWDYQGHMEQHLEKQQQNVSIDSPSSKLDVEDSTEEETTTTTTTTSETTNINKVNLFYFFLNKMK